MEDENIFNIVFIGPGLGKTNIIRRLMGKSFEKDSPRTSSASYYIKSLILDGHLFTSRIWDTCGAETMMSLSKIFLKDAKGVFVVYDITNKCSFDEIDEWIELLKDIKNSDIPMVIVGNRCDLKDRREVTVEEGELKAKKYGAEFIKTSALSGENIEKAFEILMRRVTKIGTEDLYKSVYDKLKRDYDTLKKIMIY